MTTPTSDPSGDAPDVDQPVAADTAGGAAGDAPESDAKRRFREALERKNARQHTSAAGTGGDSKVHSAHGPASHQKQFRRKSGG